MKDSAIERLTYAHFPPTVCYRFEFEADKCTHCRTCVMTCPTSCLQWNEKEKVPYATGLGRLGLACIGCNNCEAVCPAGAIRMRGEYRVLQGRYKTPEERYGDMTPPDPFKDPHGPKPFEEIEHRLTETERLIYRRRSVRLYKNKPVEKELIYRILEAGRFAPSAGNGQPVKIIVSTDKELNRKVDQASAKVLEMIEKLYAGESWWRRLVVTLMSWINPSKWDQRPIAAMAKVRQTGGVITFDAPVIFHVLKDKRGISHPDIDAALAAHNMVLCAESLGLGSCYIGFIASTAPYAPEIKKLLNIKYPWELVTSICVGYPKVKYNRPVARGPMPVEWIGEA